AGARALAAAPTPSLVALMMDQGAELALLVTGAAAQDQQGHAFGERAGDRVHHVVAAGTVGDAHHPDAARSARVAVGGEADAGLVRERHHAQTAPRPEAQKEPEDEVSGDAEEMRDADLSQVGDEEVAERHGRLQRSVPTRRTPRRRPRRR